jgi:hypothetical protein
VWLAALLVSLCAMAGQARADGDPASDVLAAQTVFLPQDGAIPPVQQAQLTQLVSSAGRAGFPLRVALIATRSDLGSVTALWRQPSAYARFLGQELSQVFHGTLLVVMPNGFGVARVGAGPADRAAGGAGGGAVGGADGGALAGSAAPGGSALTGSAAAGGGAALGGAALGGAAISAVQRLAAAAGHPLVTPHGGPSGHASVPSATGVGAWLALALGAILIGVAWTISLRQRPPRRRDGVASPHGS